MDNVDVERCLAEERSDDTDVEEEWSISDGYFGGHVFRSVDMNQNRVCGGNKVPETDAEDQELIEERDLDVYEGESAMEVAQKEKERDRSREKVKMERSSLPKVSTKGIESQGHSIECEPMLFEKDPSRSIVEHCDRMETAIDRLKDLLRDQRENQVSATVASASATASKPELAPKSDKPGVGCTGCVGNRKKNEANRLESPLLTLPIDSSSSSSNIPNPRPVKKSQRFADGLSESRYQSREGGKSQRSVEDHVESISPKWSSPTGQAANSDNHLTFKSLVSRNGGVCERESTGFGMVTQMFQDALAAQCKRRRLEKKKQDRIEQHRSSLREKFRQIEEAIEDTMRAQRFDVSEMNLGNDGDVASKEEVLCYFDCISRILESQRAEIERGGKSDTDAEAAARNEERRLERKLHRMKSCLNDLINKDDYEEDNPWKPRGEQSQPIPPDKLPQLAAPQPQPSQPKRANCFSDEELEQQRCLKRFCTTSKQTRRKDRRRIDKLETKIDKLLGIITESLKDADDVSDEPCCPMRIEPCPMRKRSTYRLPHRPPRHRERTEKVFNLDPVSETEEEDEKVWKGSHRINVATSVDEAVEQNRQLPVVIINGATSTGSNSKRIRRYR